MNKTVRFQKLFEVGRIGHMELRNRIVMAPMVTNMATEEGYVTEMMKDYYEKRAKGGVGLVIVEACCIDFPIGRSPAHEITIHDDRAIAGLSQLAQVIHRGGAKAAIQLHHAGREAKSRFTHLQPVAPSPIPAPGGELPRELTVKEIQDIATCFAEAAERAKRAGFDGVEIHAASAYLVAQFLSSASNKRQDRYGGELKNRARFLIEITTAIRESVGQTYPVWCRLNGREYGLENGITLEETMEVANMAQQAGSDAVHVWAIGFTAPGWEKIFSRGALVPLAEAVKRVVTVPVIAVGGIDPELGESVLQEGKADFIGIARGLLTDPELPGKVASERLDDIVPCIGCLECAVAVEFRNGRVICSVNPALGREREYELKRTRTKGKKVVVIGGGPAGMEAARVAALRGYDVTLYEKENELGGQLRLAASTPHTSKIEALTHYLVKQVEKLDIKVELGKEATLALIEDIEPDVVILATGASPIMPQILGLDKGLDKGKVATAVEVLAGKVEAGEKVVVMGGELVGCVTADFLTDKGKKVTICRRQLRMATGMNPVQRRLLLDRLASKGVTMLTGVTYDRWTDLGLIVTTKEGETQTIEADTIVVAAGAEPDDKLFRQLQGKGFQVYSAGDCVKPRRIIAAITDGYRIANAI